MRFLKNKLLLLSPVMAFVVVIIFTATLFPSAQVKPQNLPIAIVNEDKGVELPNQPHMNRGQTIVDRMKAMSASAPGETPAVQWIQVKSTAEAQRGLDNQAYYAAFVIPADFSAKQASLRSPAPEAPEVQIYINQGMNTAASTMAGQILNGIVDQMNIQIRTQLLQAFQNQGATLTVEQAAQLAVPIAKNVTNVNEIGTKSANGNAPVSLFQPLWMASIVSALIVFHALGKKTYHTLKENMMAKLAQMITGGVIAVVVGWGLTWLADSMVGLAIPRFADTALFLSIAFFSYFLMIYAVVSWLGMLGIPLFALLLFFGVPLLALAPEMMSSFYHHWIYIWLPMRFMVEGLRELFFFDTGISWQAVAPLTWIGAGGEYIFHLIDLCVSLVSA